MRTSPVEFTFEYIINGMVAGEMECRATANASLGRPAYTPRGEYAPIDLPEDPTVEDFDDVEVEVYERQWTAAEKAAGAKGWWKKAWVAPDEHLRAKIIAWLEHGNAWTSFLDMLAEDLAEAADLRAEYRAEQRREARLMSAAE